MINENQYDVFNKYNSKEDIVRCPRGRAPVRKKVDSYAKAAVGLYGIISLNEFIDIFNKNNKEQTNREEVYTLLLPLIFKEEYYCFYKDYIVHYMFCEDFTQADYLLQDQGEKPRYIPDEREFYKYSLGRLENNEYWRDVQYFMMEEFGYYGRVSKGFNEVRDYITYGDGINELGNILDRYDIVFNRETDFQKFIDLIMQAKNNTRIWENKGYTPSELYENADKIDENMVKSLVQQKEKVGRNDLCPCGSGKKYKKCCGRFEEGRAAQLSGTECILFYETWYGLMGFVNKKESVIKADIKPEYPNKVSDQMVHKVREVLWENPNLIDEYINEIELSQEKIDILMLWRARFKKGMFTILEYHPEYAVAIGADEQGKDKLYGIKGISNSIANVLQRELPVQVEAVLLPFEGNIIYDSFMESLPIRYGEGAKVLFREIYDNAAKDGIIISLE